MRTGTSRVVAVVGASALLVAGVGAVGYAANGDNVKVGKSKKGTKVTEIKRTRSGPALKLTTKKRSNPPFSTNATGKVVNLNADKLDGQDVADIRKGLASTSDLAGLAEVKAIRFKDPAASRAGNTIYNLGKVPAGTYQVSFNASVITTTAGTPGAPVTMSCYLQPAPTGLGGDVLAQSTVVTVGDYNTAPSFSNVLTFTGDEELQLTCATSENDGWSVSALLFFFGEPPTLTFTRLDGVTDESMTP